MANQAGRNVWAVAIVLAAIVLLFGLRFAPSVMRLGREGVVIRHPNRIAAGPAGDGHARNIAPLATVTASSEDDAPGQTGEGVADGRPDANEWVAEGEVSGAWITLTWDRPATVTEIDLYDRPGPVDNVLSGTLTFDDGSVIPVRALPAGGTPEHVTFPPKTIRSVTFRIDQAQGRNAGLGEIMVIGTLN